MLKAWISLAIALAALCSPPLANAGLCDRFLRSARRFPEPKDVESKLVLTRFQLDHSLKQNWITTVDFSTVKNGRPEDLMHAELLKYLKGRTVAFLMSDSKGTITSAEGLLEEIDFSDPKMSAYRLKTDRGDIAIIADDDNQVSELRVKKPEQGNLQFFDFLAEFGIRENNLQKTRSINEVYSQINEFQKWTRQPNTAAWDKVEKAIIKLDSNLISGNLRAIYNEWLGKFNEVQSAYDNAMAAEAEIEKLVVFRAVDPPNARKHEIAISALQNQVDRSSEIIGRYYQSIREAQKKVAQVVNDSGCSGSCADNAKAVAEMFGMPYPTRTTEAEMPSNTDLKNYLKAHPLAKFAQLTDERNQQITAILKLPWLRKAILELADTAATNTPWINQTKAVQLLKIFYDALARDEDFPKITAVLRNQGELSNKFDQLRGFAAEDPDVLVTFARRVDTFKLWNDLKGYAQTSDPYFYSKMEDAEKQRRTKGDVALADGVDWANVIAISMVLGGTSYAGYEYEKHKDGIFDKLAEVFKQNEKATRSSK